MIPIIYIYCYWTWVFTLLFFLKLTPYSPLFSLIGAFIFTSYNNIANVNSDISLRAFIILWELLLIMLVLLKTEILDIKFNIMLFLVYYLILLLNNYNFYKIYFIELPKYYNPTTTALDFISKRINYISNYF